MRLIDNEDIGAVLATMTRSSAVVDRRNNLNREDFDYIADQLLGASTMTRKEKIDIADLSTVIQDINTKAVALVLGSISPTTMSKAGAAVQTLTLNGSGFTHGCTVKVNGVAVPYVFVSATQLTTQITLASYAIASYNVQVTDQYRSSAIKSLGITA